MNRVLNPSKYLRGIVKENQKYYIGFGVKDLTNLAKSYPPINDLINGKRSTIVVSGKKGVLKENTEGKWVRKQPESKHYEWKHIEYYSKKFEKTIEYDREFEKWIKVILHQYNLELELAKSPQNEIILHFPQFQFKDAEDHYLIAGAAMNIAILLGS